MKKLSSLLLVCLAVGAVHAQRNIVGAWEGKLSLGNNTLRLVFHIAKDSAGGYKATMDSPDQGVKDLGVDKIDLKNDSLTMELPAIRGKASGKLVNDSTFTGQWTQGMSLPLQLKKVAVPSTVNRPQTPKPPFPYKAEDVLYTNKDKSMQYGATITIPEGAGPFPAMILVTGSGQQNRDEELFGHKPFAVIADYLTRKGYIVLRVDDRGMGETTGDVMSVNSKTFAEDVKVGLDYLKGRKEVAKTKVGILGHSEGGMIAQLVAAERPDIAFVVSLAGPGQKIEALMLEQNLAVMRSNGLPAAAVEEYASFYKVFIPAIVHAPSDSAAQAVATKLLGDWVKKTPKATVSATLGIADEKEVDRVANTFVESIRSPWFSYFIQYDPVPYIKKMKAKVLVLNGDRDVQVVSKSNLDGWRAALAKSSVKKYDIKELKGLNHLFQQCKTCTVQEYGTLEQTIAPEALEVIGDWLKENVK